MSGRLSIASLPANVLGVVLRSLAVALFLLAALVLAVLVFLPQRLIRRLRRSRPETAPVADSRPTAPQ